MHIFAKVISVDEKAHTMTVRYWTDELSEADLLWTPDLSNSVCKTDTLIDLAESDMSEDELRQAIDFGAPVIRLEALTKIKKGEKFDSIERAKKMIGDVRDIWV